MYVAILMVNEQTQKCHEELPIHEIKNRILRLTHAVTLLIYNETKL